MQANYEEKLKEIDHDVDEIMHSYKQKYKQNQAVGNILQDLFSQEELEEEGRVALGEKRKTKEIKIKKLELSNEENWDMNLESEDSSGPPSQLDGTGLVFYDKLHGLKQKLYKYRHPDNESLKNSLDNAFMESLPISMKSVSNCESFKLTNLLSGLKSRDSSLLLEQNYSKTNEFKFDIRSSVTTKPEYEKNDYDFGTLLSENKLSLDEQEQLVLTLIDQELPNGRDVCLDDLLDITRSEPSNKASTILATEENVSDNSFSSFLQADYSKNPQNESLISSGTLTFKKPDLSFNNQTENSFIESLKEKSFKNSKNFTNGMILSPIQSVISTKPPFVPRKMSPKYDFSNESSIAYAQDTSLSVLSDNSILSPDEFNRSKHKNRKRKPLLNRPKLSDKEDSNSSILPPLNTSNDSKRPKLMLLPKPPTEPPIKRFLNIRGRSLQPLSTPKSRIIPDLTESKFNSPVINFRLKRFKEMTRPHMKVAEGVFPQEPQKFF